MSDVKFHMNKRIFMLDCARKYFTPAWIKKLIDEISSVGYNTIVLHFSEDMGMRLESKQYPWLAGGDHSLCTLGAANGRAEDDGKYIRQAEMSDIVRHAQARGMEVIPSFDSPGHMNYIVKKYNARFEKDIGNYFHQNGKKSLVHGSSANKEPAQTAYSRGIDIANPEATAFAKSLYEEYGKFFLNLGCTGFNICGDELLGWGEKANNDLTKWQNLDHWQAYAQTKTGNPRAVAYDAFVLYMNETAALLRAMGYKTVYMWNDDIYRFTDTDWKEVVKIDKDIEVFHWASAANACYTPAFYYLERGHRLYNFTRKYNYYVLFPSGSPTFVTPEQITGEWSPYLFDTEEPKNNPQVPNENVGGAGFCLWCDAPACIDEDELLARIRPYYTAIIEKIV